MMGPGERWTDDRLDDLANTVWSMREMPMKVAVLTSELEAIETATKQCGQEVANLRSDFNDSRRGLSRSEKIALFSAMVAFLGMIVAAVALVAGGMA